MGVPQSPSDDVDDDGYYYRSMLTMNQEKKINNDCDVWSSVRQLHQHESDI
jgi:hypothetical protein